MAWMMARESQHLRPLTPTSVLCWSHTLPRRVFAKVLGLVSTEKAGGLDCGSGTTGELLVEVDDALHAECVGGSTNGLHPVSQQFFPSSVSQSSPDKRNSLSSSSVLPALRKLLQRIDLDNSGQLGAQTTDKTRQQKRTFGEAT